MSDVDSNRLAAFSENASEDAAKAVSEALGPLAALRYQEAPKSKKDAVVLEERARGELVAQHQALKLELQELRDENRKLNEAFRRQLHKYAKIKTMHGVVKRGKMEAVAQSLLAAILSALGGWFMGQGYEARAWPLLLTSVALPFFRLTTICLYYKKWKLSGYNLFKKRNST